MKWLLLLLLLPLIPLAVGYHQGKVEKAYLEGVQKGVKLAPVVKPQDPILWWTGDTDLIQARKKLCQKK